MVTENISIKKGYKQTSIGLLPEDWKVDRVDKNFEFLPSNSFSRVDLIYQPTVTGIQNVHYGDLHSKFKFEILDCDQVDLPYIKDELLVNKKFNFIQDGDLIIADASEDYEGVGESVEIKNVGSKKITSGLHTFLARDKSKQTALGFRTYIFKHQKVRVELKKIATGTSVYSISKSQLGKLLIPIPPLPEQQKIASILSTWDEAIAKQKSLVEQTKKRNQGLAQQLLTGKKRLKGFDGKWIEVKADKIFKSHTNKNHNGDLEILSATQERGVIPRSMNNIDIKYDVNSLGTYKKVEVGNFVISLRSFQGGIEYSEYEGIVSPAYTILKEIVPVSKTFYKVYFKTGNFIKRLNTIIYGIRDGKQIGFGDFATLKLPCPELKEQEAISKVLEQASFELKKLEQQLALLQNEKKGLMQKLLTGEVRVKIN